MGFDWVDVMLDIPDSNVSEATRGNNGPVRIVAVTGRLPMEWIAGVIGGKTPNYATYLWPEPPFRPFDEGRDFPGRKVAYYAHSFHDFDVGRWYAEYGDGPDNIDIDFEYVPYKRKLAVVATTFRNGGATKVRKNIPTDKSFLDAIGPIVQYFSRNCPKVDQNHVQTAMGGSHLNTILRNLNAIGTGLLKGWMENTQDLPSSEGAGAWEETGRRRQTITQDMLAPGHDIDSLDLIRREGSSKVLADMKFAKGNSLVDDQQGTTITLKAILPESTLVALKGRPLSDLINASWARDLVIRTARSDNEKIIVRASSDIVKIALSGDTMPHQEVEKRLRSLLEGEMNYLKHVDEDAMPILQSLSPEALLGVLSVLKGAQNADLSIHGRPGWILRRGMRGIEVIKRPQGRTMDIVDAVIALERKRMGIV